MKLENQSHLFNIPDHIAYFNMASYSPSFQSVEKAGIDAVLKKSHPYEIQIDDFFSPLKKVKQLFSKIIDTEDFERITTIPSVSYGMATIANNIKLKSGDEILLIEDQFPSNYYIWKRLADQCGASLKIIKQPIAKVDNAKKWNQEILNAINEKTSLISLGQVHWSNGTIFDLKNIRKKTKKHNALFIIDGSQSVGALPFSVKEIEPDALVCAGYKWLFGPYGCAYAYYGPFFDEGIPIEENWINRTNSENFAGLTDYSSTYKPLANRYGVGQGASFIYIQMMIAALKQLTYWKPKYIQNYCKEISSEFVSKLKSLGCTIEQEEDRSHHMFGILLPESINHEDLKNHFTKENIFISFRGSYLRVSCHLFNTEEDFEKLYQCIAKFI